MNSYEAAVLSCRMLALYIIFLVLSATGLVGMAFEIGVDHRTMLSHGMPDNPSNNVVLLANCLPLLLNTAFAAFLWFAAPWFAKRMMVAMSPDMISSPIRVREVLTTALVIVGVWVLVQMVPDTVKAIATAVLMTAYPEQAGNVKPEMTAEYWALIVRFALGLGLIFGAARISNALGRSPGVEITGVEQG